MSSSRATRARPATSDQRSVPRRLRTSLPLLLVLAGCERGHDARADSLALAELVAREAVPVITPGRTAELSVRTSVGGPFDSVLVARMVPVVGRLRGDSAAGRAEVLLEVGVESFSLAGDSAEAVVARRGRYRADTTRYSSSRTRYRYLWTKEGGWTLAQTDPFEFAGEGQPPARARDLWWPSRDSAGAAAKPPTP